MTAATGLAADGVVKAASDGVEEVAADGVEEEAADGVEEMAADGVAGVAAMVECGFPGISLLLPAEAAKKERRGERRVKVARNAH